jgi:hypothetical protein
MPHLYNMMCDETGVNEWYPTKKAAVAAAKAWAKGSPERQIFVVERHEIDRLSLAYACKLIEGRGFSISSEEIYRTKGDTQ